MQDISQAFQYQTTVLRVRIAMVSIIPFYNNHSPLIAYITDNTAFSHHTEWEIIMMSSDQKVPRLFDPSV